MLVRCSGCNTAYRISDERVPPGGAKVRCPKCRVVFTIRREVHKEPETLGEKLFGKDVAREALFQERPEKGVEEKVRGKKSEAAEEARRTPERPPSVERSAAGEAAREAAPREAAREGKREAVSEAVPRDVQAEAASRAASREAGPRAERAKKGTKPEEEPARVDTEKGETEVARETMREMAREVVAEPVTPTAPPQTPPCGPAQVEPPVSPFKAAEEDPRTLARALISDVLFYNREKRDKGLAEGKVLAYLSREIARSWELYKDRVGIEKAVETDYFREAVNDILGEGKKIL